MSRRSAKIQRNNDDDDEPDDPAAGVDMSNQQQQQQQQPTRAVVHDSSVAVAGAARHPKCSFLDSWLDSYRRFQQQQHQQQEHPSGGGENCSSFWFWIQVQFRIALEIALSWIVCILCATYYISRYRIETWSIQRRIPIRTRFFSSIRPNEQDDYDDPTFALPLTTQAKHSRQEQDLAGSIDQQYKVLQEVLHNLEAEEETEVQGSDIEKLITRIRQSSPDVRCLVSRFIMSARNLLSTTAAAARLESSQPQQQQQQHAASTTTSCPPWLMLYRQLQGAWPNLLELPPLFREDEEEEGANESPITTASTSSMNASSCSSRKADCTAAPHNEEKSCSLQDGDFDIAVIVPAFRESGRVLRRTLLTAQDRCRQANRVVVVVVNAGQCTELHLLQQTFAATAAADASSSSSTATTASSSSLPSSCCSCQTNDPTQDTTTFVASSTSCSGWGAFALIPFQQQQQQQEHEQQKQQSPCTGRGPTLNYGAAWVQSHISIHNTTRRRRKRPLILTFLHADTLLPQDWDVHVQKALGLPNDGIGSGQQENGSTNPKYMIVQACAFSFGHDLSEEGLSSYHDSLSATSSLPSSSIRYPYPWGIRAVQWLGNLRASWARLPYGDHVISMPDVYFHFLGGFPNQPIMEDYELMDLLRQRARIFTSSRSDRAGVVGYEDIVILPTRAQCSVRRWQKHGVVYTTLVNALIVHRYSRRCNAWTPDDVFDYYYNHDNNSSTRQEKEEEHQQSSATTSTMQNGSNKKVD
jgi:hypothetical protein